MTDELDNQLDEILLDITPNLTSSHGDPDSYDAYDPSSQIAREKLTHRCLTCGLPECKPWYETKQAIEKLIDEAYKKGYIDGAKEYIRLLELEAEL
jgi:hypothetical protein